MDTEKMPDATFGRHEEFSRDDGAIMAERSVLTDAELLAAMGHNQELQRGFSVWSLGALCLCLMATWEALGTVVAAALIAGGAPCLFYN